MRRIIILIISMFLLGTLAAENYYWMNGSGNWEDPGHWSTDQYSFESNGKIPGMDDNVVILDNGIDQTNQLNENTIIANLHWEAGEIDGYNGVKLTVSGELNTSKTVTDQMIEKSIEQGSGNLNNHININSSDSDKEKLSAQTPNITTTDKDNEVETRAAPTFTAVNLTNASCFNTNDGIIEIIVDDADEYSIDNGTTWQAANEFFGLSAGSYNVVARKGVDETAWGGNPVEITAPTQLTYDGATIDHVVCNGDDNGRITINVSGGTPPYTYDAGGAIVQTGNNVFENLEPTSYTFQITDDNGCPTGILETPKLTVLEAPVFTVTNATTTAVSCGGAGDGAIEIFVNGGQAPYTYRIEAVVAGTVTSFTTSDLSYEFTGLDGDDYDIYATDDYGCEFYYGQLTIVEPPVLVINSVTPTDVTGCFGNSNGQIQITSTGGFGTRFYSINGGTSYFPNGGNFTNLPAGDYNVQVRDQNNCVTIWGANPVTLTEPAQVEITATNVVQPVCFGDNGTITVTTVIGGDGGPYEYSSDGGATWQAGNSFLLPEGSYNIVARDGNNCESDPVVIDLDAPDQITFDATPTDVTCNGGADGQIVVSNVLGGSGAGYEYSNDNGATFQASNTFLGLSAGTYNIVVRDGNLCESPADPTVVDEPDAIAFNPVPNPMVSCNGGNDGVITFTNVTGGTAPYEYSIDNGATWQGSTIFNNLTVGTYNTQVRDANLCLSAIQPVDITEPGAINFTPVINSQVTCNGGNDGEIEITNVTGGTGPFTYSNNGGATWQASATFSILAAGDYDMRVRDANLCESAIQQVTITQPAAITFTPQINSQVTCNGGADGEIEITLAAGGTAPYEYSNDGGATWQASATFSGLTAGTYDMRVRDVNLCLSAIIPRTIIEPAAITFTPVVNSNVLCNGSNEGEIEVTNVSGGTAPYEYSNDGGATWQASATFSNLIAGTYDIVVRDVNLCESAAQPTDITEPDPIAFNTIDVNPTCNGNTDGSITVNNVTGGTAPYEYSNDGGATWQASPIFGSLGDGTYNMQVRDVNLCASPVTPVTLNEPAPINFTPVVNQNVTCFGGADGEIEITNVTGGTAPYEYSNDGGATWQASPVFSLLPAATYDMKVRDANLCESADQPTDIIEPNVIAFDTNVTPVTCNGGSDGSIEIINVTGGTPGYEYSIDKGVTYQAGNIFNGLPAGNYNVQVRDANLCESDPVIVNLPEPAVVTFNTDVDNVSCNGGADGQIEVIDEAGGSGVGYTYSNDGGATWQASPIFAGLTAGIYDMQVRDDNLCLSAIVPTTVTEPDPIDFDTDMDPVACNGGADGSIEIINVTGGTAPFEYSNDGGATWQASPIFGGLSAGFYDMQVRDANLCTSAIQSTEVTEPDPLANINAVVTNVTCNGGSDGEIEIIGVTGGIPPYEYSNDGGATWQVSPIFAGLSAGTYNMQVRDANLCTSPLLPTDVLEPAAITFTPIVNANVTCNGGADGEIEVTNVLGGTPGYEYSNDGGATWQANPVFSGLAAGTYDMQVRDVNLCLSVITPIDVIEPDVVDFDTDVTNVTCNGGADGEIEVINVTGGSGAGYEYSNDGGATWQANPVFAGLSAGTYDMQVRDGNLCVSAIQPTAVTEPDPILFNTDITNVSCDGGNDGEIEVTNVTGGTPPYEYSNDGGATWQASPIFGLLTAGTYDMQVRDVNLCVSAIVPTEVTDPDPIAFNSDLTNVSCNGGSDGSIEFINVTGGTPAYEYSIDGGTTWQPDPLFENLTAGGYNLVIRDGNLCVSAPTPVTLTQPDAITFNTNNTNISCNGGSDGIIEVINVLGGSGAGYEYSIDGGATWQASPIFPGLIADTYDVVVRDGNLCESLPLPVILTEPDAITYDTTLTNVTCNGGGDGSIEVIDVLGGTPPYEYSIDNGATFQVAALFENLTAGTYDVVVRDANLCLSDVFVAELTEPDPIVITLIDSLLSCGSLPVIDGNPLPLPDGSGVSYETTLTYTDFDPGQTLNVGDIAGLYLEIEHSYPGDLIIELVAPDNTIVLSNGRGGTRNLGYPVTGDEGAAVPGEGYVYTFDDDATKAWTAITSESYYYNGVPGPQDSLFIPAGTYIPENSFDGLAGTLMNGDWTLRVTDQFPVDNGFIFKWGIRFNESAYPANYCNGMLEVVATGGNGGFTYEWSNGQSGAQATELCADGYTVTVTDALGCSTTYTDSVYDVDIHLEVIDTTHVACAGEATGSATVLASGGNAPYTYDWSNGASGQTANNLTAGWYFITITDNNQCEHVDSLEILSLYDLQLVFSDTIPIICNPVNIGDSTGGITVTPIGGSGNYTYSWSSTDGNDSVATNLTAGWNYVTVTDDFCSAIDSVFFDVPDPIQIIETLHQDVLCNGDTTGAISIVVNNGAAPLTLEWDHIADLDVYDLTNLGAGAYTALVTDNNACMEDTTIIITEPAPFTYDVVVTPSDCGVENGSIEVQNILGGDGNYTVTWSNPDWTVDSVGLSITNLGVGNYTLMIQDGNLCDTIEVINMPDISDISVSLVSKVDPTCATSCDGQATIEIIGGTEPYTITWSNGATDVLSVNDLCDGPFTVTVVDDNNCSFELIDSVQAPDPIINNGFIYTDPIACAGDSIAELYVSAEGGTGELSFIWQDTASNVVSADSILTNAGAGNRYYVTITDENLCELIDSVDIPAMPDSIFMEFTTGVTNCPEDSTGWAAVDVTGGVGPYSYNWYKADEIAFPIVGSDTDSASSLAFGYYIVEVTDMLGCTVIDSVIIQSNTTLDFDVEVLQEVTCLSDPQGSATVDPLSIVNGVGPYSYDWSSGETTDTAYALEAGTNFVILTDENSGCSVIKEFFISSENALFVADNVGGDYGNDINPNGFIELSVSGGVPDYTYMWEDASGQPLADTDEFVSDLESGWYFWSVTDQLGCVVADSSFVDSLYITYDTILLQNVSCYTGNDGAIEILPYGGSGDDPSDYTVTWSYDGWENDSIGFSITNLEAGIYTIVISDGGEYPATYTIEVTEPDPYVLDTEITPAACDDSTGQIIVEVVSGGTAPFTFEWDYNGYPILGDTADSWVWTDPRYGDTINDLHVGWYYYTLTDFGGCVYTDSIFLPDNSNFALNAGAFNPRCYGENSGRIELSPTNGIEPYTFNWTPDGGWEDEADNLEAGIYSVTVIDDDLCVDDSTFVITEPDSIVYDILDEDAFVTCFDGNDGQITINAFGGTPEYDYLIRLIDSVNNVVYTDSIITGLGYGQYRVRIEDSKGCLSEPGFFFVQSETPEIVIDPDNEMPGCPTDTNGIARVIVSEGQGAPGVSFTSLSYEWKIDSATLAAWGAPQAMYDSIISRDSVVVDARPGVYNLKVTTLSGCIEEQDVTLLSDTSFVFDEIGMNLVDTSIYGMFASLKTIDACKYDPISLYAAPYAIKADPYQIIDADTVYWSRGAGLAGYGMSGSVAFDTAVVNLTGANYYVARIEAGRCYMEDSIIAIVPNYADVVAGVDDDEYTQVFENGRTVLTVNDITDSTYYSWTEYWEVTGELPPVATLPEDADSTVSTSLEVTGLQDSTIYTVVANTPSPYPVANKFCQTTDTVKIRVMGEFNPPSAFSPNGDGINDTWLIYGIDENFSFNLKIYNRWGQLVFESKDAGEMLYEGWDGTNMNGNDVTIGTYYYVIEYSDGTKTRKANGPVTVIR